MASIAAGRYYLNGKDLFLIFGIGIEKGSADFLRFPEKKESITHDWMDANGVDTDLSKFYIKEKEVKLDCFMLANSVVDFWQKYETFLAEITQPGVQRLEIAELDKSFYVYYSRCTEFTRVTRIKETSIVGCRFSLILVEQQPELNPDNVYLIDEDGRFIIT